MCLPEYSIIFLHKNVATLFLAYVLIHVRVVLCVVAFHVFLKTNKQTTFLKKSVVMLSGDLNSA
jgi:hypothetical protein